MPRSRETPALVVGGALRAGCATSDSMYLVRREVHCSPLGEPIGFLPERPVEPHVDIARIEASGAIFIPTSWEVLRTYLCREALAVEADAVIDLDQDHISYSIGFTPLEVDWTNEKLTAVAIRFLRPGQVPDEVEVPVPDEGGRTADAVESADGP